MKYLQLLLLFIVSSFVFSSANAAPKPPPEGGYKWDKARVAVQRDQARLNLGVSAQKTYPVSTLDQHGKPINGTRTATSTIKVAPTANKVGKTLMKRTPMTAIGYAVTALLGRAVDWVLDPANNAVKYKDPNAGAGQLGEYYYQNAYYPGNASRKNYSTWQAACNSPEAIANLGKDSYVVRSDGIVCIIYSSGNSREMNVSINKIKNPDYDPAAPTDDYKYLPIDTVAAQVISNADAGQAPATQVLSDTVLDMFNAGELDSQLDSAADPRQPDPDFDPSGGTGGETDPDGETGGETPDPDPNPDPNEQPKPTEWPAFCDWAFKVCDFVDWMQADPPEDGDGDVSVEEPDANMHVPILERLYISMPAQCPPDPVLEFMGAKIPFPMSVFCQFAQMMKPLILLFAYIKGLSIIGNGLN